MAHEGKGRGSRASDTVLTKRGSRASDTVYDEEREQCF